MPSTQRCNFSPPLFIFSQPLHLGDEDLECRQLSTNWVDVDFFLYHNVFDNVFLCIGSCEASNNFFYFVFSMDADIRVTC